VNNQFEDRYPPVFIPQILWQPVWKIRNFGTGTVVVEDKIQNRLTEGCTGYLTIKRTLDDVAENCRGFPWESSPAILHPTTEPLDGRSSDARSIEARE